MFYAHTNNSRGFYYESESRYSCNGVSTHAEGILLFALSLPTSASFHSHHISLTRWCLCLIRQHHVYLFLCDTKEVCCRQMLGLLDIIPDTCQGAFSTIVPIKMWNCYHLFLNSLVLAVRKECHNSSRCSTVGLSMIVLFSLLNLTCSWPEEMQFDNSLLSSLCQKCQHTSVCRSALCAWGAHAVSDGLTCAVVPDSSCKSLLCR